MAHPDNVIDPRPFFDLGHQGDVDRTQIALLLKMTPTRRLRHHEGWRPLLTRWQGMPNFLEETVVRLSQHQVEYVIVGGVSAVLQGAPIVTRDLDICYRRTPENIARLVAAFAPLNPRLRNCPPELPFVFDERTLQLGSNFTLEIESESLDLLGEMSGLGGYDQIISETKEVQIGVMPVKVLSLTQLIITKEAAGRLKDHAVLPLIKATLELQQQHAPSPDDSSPSHS